MASTNNTNDAASKICAYEYTVKRGDSFYLISHRLGVPLRDLLAANTNINPARLMVGDVLCIPTEESGQHVPQPGSGGAQSVPDTVQSAPQTSQTVPDTVQSAPQTSQTVPDTVQSAPQTSQTVPDTAQSAPQTSQTVPDTARSAPQTSQTVPDTAQSAPEIILDTAPQAAPAVPHETADIDPGMSVCPESSRVTIRQGQTVSDLQIAHQLNLHTLETANPSLDLENLTPGQVVCVPDTNIPCPLPTNYTLQTGDTLESVALKFNLPIAAILRANPCMAPADFEACACITLPR